MTLLRTFFAALALLFCASAAFPQTVIFSEDFEPMAGPEYNGATTGTSAEGYIWNTNCPSCTPPDDIFETQNGAMRGEDTNGPAFFTVNGIDATGCFVLTFQFDYNSVGYSGSGNLECAEECPFNWPPYCSGNVDEATTNPDCNNCWDFLAWEINSGTATDDDVVLGLDCNANASGTEESNPLCLAQAGADPSNVNITITMSMWATNEWMEFDNITILCYTEQEANDAGLPIPADCGGSCMIDIDDVIIGNVTCAGGDDGSIDIDATGTGVNGSLEYSIDGGIIFETSNLFENLTAGTYDIVVQDDSDGSCFATTTVTITEPASIVIGNPSPVIVCYTLIPPDGEILNLDDVIDELTNFDPTLDVNWFFDMDGNDPLDPTDPGDITTLIINFQTTVYASVSDGTCESNIVPVTIDLNEYPDADDAMLSACPDANGDATFTPGDADADISSEPGVTITYHNTPGDAETGDDPILGDVTTSTNLTLYASVQNGAGCISTAELDLVVEAGPTPQDATLEVCDDGNGEGTFDLTEVEDIILDGQSGTVIFYEDSGLNDEIFNPGSYTSGPGTIFAVIDDGSGCVSAPAEVSLNVVSIDPNDLFLTLDPDEACGDAIVGVTINTPADPPGDYTFQVSYGPVSTGPTNNITLIGMDGANNFFLGITESHVFVINSVTGPGSPGCEVIFDPPAEFFALITDGPEAFPASITVCANAQGDGVFDLTSVEDEINNFSGLPVDFYEDDQLNTIIGNPSMYTSGPTTVYAVVDDGTGCTSAPVEVTLNVEAAPDPVDLDIDITSSCEDETVTLTFSLPSGESFDLNLIVTDGSGSTNNLLTGVENNDQLSFMVTETTFFTIDEITTSTGCTFSLAPTPSVNITIDGGFTPNPAALGACDNGTGEAFFDLTEADATVNGNSGNPVVWYTDMAATDPIGTPNNYLSGGGLVYATVDNGVCESETVEVTLTVFDLPTAAITLDDFVTCEGGNDGGISVVVTGPMPYTFDWNDNTYDGQQVLTDLEAGFYSLTLTDGNGCQAFADIELTEPPALELSCNVINNETAPDANNGVLGFDLAGGTPVYNAVLTGPLDQTFNDLPAGPHVIDNLPPGDYILTVTDNNGCTTDCLFTIEAVVCALDFTLEANNVTCNGAEDGNITVIIDAGTPDYTYDWTDDQFDGESQLDDLPPGTYTLTVIDALGCSLTQSITITQPMALVLDCQANGPGQGNGPGSYTFTYAGGTPDYTLELVGPENDIFTETEAGSWATEVLPDGDYVFSVLDDNGCSISCAFTIDPNCDLTLDLSGTDPTCNGATDGTLTLDITTTAGITSIDWNVDALDGMTMIENAGAGTYSVVVTDDNGCTASASITLENPEAYAIDCTATTLPSGPGATDGVLTVTINNGPGGPYTVTYDNGSGTNGTITEGPVGVYTQNNLPTGIYQITVSNAAGCTADCSINLEADACPLTLAQTVVAPTCSDATDGSITVTPTDGTPDYTFDWSDDAFDGSASATGLPAGTALSVTVTDAVGCTGTLDFVVPTTAAISLDCTQTTNPSGSGTSDGSINVTVGNGTAPYTITWSGPVSGTDMLAAAGDLLIDNLSAGAYTITVEDANGCSADCASTLSGACDLALELTGENPDCAGAATGSLDLIITGSAAIATIDWNVDALDGTEDPQMLAAGTYEVVVTDVAGCTATANITLTDPPAITVDCSQLTHPTTPAGTNGGVDVVVGGGAPPYNVSWDGPVTGMTIVNAPGTFSISNLSVGAYTITVEDANGCQEFCGFVMVNNENCNFSIVLSGTDASCNGETDGTINFQLIEGEPNFTFTWNDSSLDEVGPNGNQTNLGAGFYSVTVVDNSNCVASGTFTVGEPPAILFSCTATTQPSSGTATDGVITVDFTSGPGGPYTLTYDNGAGTMGSMPIVPGLTTIDNLPVGNYTITIDDGECSAECTAELIDSSCTFDLSIAVTPEQCAGAADGTAMALPQGGVEPYTYAWNNLADTPTITDLPAGEYTVTVTDADDCVAIATTTVLPGTALPTVAAGSGGTICADSCFALPLTFTGTAPFDLTYMISFGGSTSELQQTFAQVDGELVLCPDALGVPAGDFSLTLTDLIDASSCSDELMTVINFTYLLPATGTFSATICAEDSVQIGDAFFSFDNPGGQVVLPGAASSGCDSTVVVALDFFAPSVLMVESDLCTGDSLFYGGVVFTNNNLSDTIVLENGSDNGCDSTIMVNLTLLEASGNPINPQLCAGDTLIIAGEIFDENRPFDIIELPNQAANGCDSLIIVTLDIVPLVPAPLAVSLCVGDSITIGDSTIVAAGSYDILLPDASANGCDSLVALTLDFYPPAESTFNATFCAGETVMVGDSLFSENNTSGTVVLPGASSNGCDSTVVVDLTFLPGVSADLDTILCFGESLTVGGQTFDAQNPMGSVVLAGMAANGCDSTVNVTTTYLPELFASVGSDTLICGDQMVDAVVTLSPGATYDFSVQVSTGFLLEVDDAEGGEYTFNPGTITDDVTLELVNIVSSTGCPVIIENDLATIRFSDTQLTLNSTGGTGASDLSCADALDGSISVETGGGVGPFSYAWNTGDTGATLSNLGAGTYTVTVIDAPGCSVEESITFVAPPPLVVEAQGISAGCFGETTGSVLIDTVFGGTGPYEFSLDNEFFAGLGAFPNVLPDLAAGAYTVYIQDANDCQTSVNLAVPVGVQLELDLGDDQTIEAGDSVLLDPIYVFEAADWVWTPPTGLRNPDSTVTWAAPLETTIYQLEITDPNGCSASDIVRIIVENNINIYVPNAFSPDGDGTNDELTIYAGQGVEMIESFQIFDRWGDQVYVQGPFPPNDPNFGWDGRLNGELMNPAVFVYFARVRMANGEVITVEGDFVLLR